MKRQVRIDGIPCTLKTPAMVDAVRRVLRQIRERYPDDHARLVKSVRGFVPLGVGEAAEGVNGAWREQPSNDDPSTWGWGYTELAPGAVSLLDEEPPNPSTPLAVVAHELGHAATLFGDMAARGDCSNDEWASELTADWYAYRWGFGRQIAAHRRVRCWKHHCVGPGQTIEEVMDGVLYRFRLTRAFRLRLVEKRKLRKAEMRELLEVAGVSDGRL